MNKLLLKFFPSSIAHLMAQESGLRRIIVNTGWLFVDNVVGIVAGLLVGAWVARYLGPTQFGVYNFALAIVALFTPLVMLGLKDIVIRDIVRKPKDKDEILGTVFGLQIVGGGIALGLAIGVAQFTQSENVLVRWLIAILAGQFVFQAFNTTLDYWFQAQVQSRYTVWARNIGMILIAVIKIGLIFSRAPLIAFAWAALIQAFVFTVALTAFHRLSGQILSTWRISLVRAKRLLNNSWPLFFSDMATIVYMKIGQVMLGNMIGAKELGLYSAAVRLSEVWYFIPVAISSSVFPAIVNSRENDSNEVRKKRMQIFYDVMTVIAYLIVIPLVFLAPFLVKVLFGSYYIEAGSILRIHAVSLLFVFLGVSRNNWIISEDMVQFNMVVTVLGAMTNIALNFILIPEFGGLGVAWAVVISQAVSTYLSSLLSRRLWPVFGQQSLSLLVPLRILSLRKALNEFAVNVLQRKSSQ